MELIEGIGLGLPVYSAGSADVPPKYYGEFYLVDDEIADSAYDPAYPEIWNDPTGRIVMTPNEIRKWKMLEEVKRMTQQLESDMTPNQKKAYWKQQDKYHDSYDPAYSYEKDLLESWESLKLALKIKKRLAV